MTQGESEAERSRIPISSGKREKKKSPVPPFSLERGGKERKDLR